MSPRHPRERMHLSLERQAMNEPGASGAKEHESASFGKDAVCLIRPEELHRIAQEKEMAAAHRDLAAAESAAEHQAVLHRAFMERHLHPQAMERFSRMVRRAAELGERRIELVRFPSDWCSDRGRAINNAEDQWPMTLEGIAKEGYEAFAQWLRPLGYHISARIVDYPGGKPGDVALYVSW
jgi:hypothetical protein